MTETLNTPPRSLESEQAIISAILKYGKRDQAVREVMDELHSDMFYSAANRAIFAEAQQLENPDFIQMMDLVRENKSLHEIVPFSYLQSYAKSSVAKANISAYAANISDSYQKRQLIALANSIQDACYENANTNDVLQMIKGGLINSEAPSSYEPKHISEALSDYVGLLEKRVKGDPSVVGSKTGLTQLDKQIVGLGKTWLTVLAGRPSHGKTLVAQIIASHIAQTAPTMFFSMEMSEVEILDREFCLATDITPSEIRTGLLTEHQFAQVSEIMTAMKSGTKKSYIDTTPSLSINQICARAKAFKRKHPDAGLIQIDYLGLMQKPKAERNDIAIAEITMRLKQLSKEIEVPIMLLAQCNRAADTAKRLTMQNLADSASIERDADLVLFVHKEEVSNPDTNMRGIIELSCGKFRHGSFDSDVWIKKCGLKMDCMNDEEISMVKQNSETKQSGYRKGLDI